MFRIAGRALLRRVTLLSHRPTTQLQLPVLSAAHYPRAYSITTSGTQTPTSVDQLTANEYHRITEDYLELLTDHLVDLSEDYPQLDAEYSHGVLSLEVPNVGSYVINKQPPNKQIWLSSPISGPDRFDPIKGKWVSLRTSEALGDILRREIGEGLGEEVTLEGIDDI